MKKTLFVAAVISVMVFAGVALANGRHHGRGDWDMGGRDLWQEAAPKEILDKRAEIRSIGSQIRAEMSKNPVDRALALELFRKRNALRGEVEEWSFTQRLDYIISQGGLTPRTNP